MTGKQRDDSGFAIGKNGGAEGAGDTLPEKQHVHELIDRLEPSQIQIAARFLEFMVIDPVSRSIATAPVDDEPLTEEAIQAIEASNEWFRRNKGISHEEMLAEFGLKPENFAWNRGESDLTSHIRIWENNFVGIALQLEKTTTVTLSLPSELHRDIVEKAQAMDATFDSVAAVLLQHGLGVQMQRERAIRELAEKVASSDDVNEQNAASDKLGEMIFGK